MEPCIVRYSIWKNFISFLMAIIIFLSSLSMLITKHQSATAWTWVALILFGFGIFIFGYRTLNRKPLLIIHTNGITHGKDWIGLIPWSDITNIKIDGKRVRILHIYVKNPEELEAKRPRTLFSRLWKLLNSRSPFNTPLTYIDTPVSTVRSVIEKFLSVKPV